MSPQEDLFNELEVENVSLHCEKKILSEDNRELRILNQQLADRVSALERSLRGVMGGGRPGTTTIDVPGQGYLDGLGPGGQGDGIGDTPADESNEAGLTDKRTKTPHKRGGSLKALDMDDLPEEIVSKDVPEEERLDANGYPLPIIDRKRSSKLAYRPGQYYKLTEETPVYGHPEDPPECGISADATPAIIADGQVHDSVLIFLLIAVFGDHLPVYRLENQAARQGIPLGRPTLNRWLIRALNFLEPIHDAIAISIMLNRVIHMDDTTFRIIMPSDKAKKKRRKSHLGRVWNIATKDEAWFLYADTREGKWVDQLLSDFEGFIVADDCKSHLKLLAREGITGVHCWAHCLRKFREAADTVHAPVIVGLIKELYAVEDDIIDLPAEERLLQRHKRSRPILDRLDTLVDELTPKTTPKSDLGAALRYTQRLRTGLREFLNHADIPLDNNPSERGMRPIAISRKNRMFAFSEIGANANAIGFTIFESCRRIGVNFSDYLPEAIAGLHAGRPPEELTPLAWKRQRGR